MTLPVERTIAISGWLGYLPFRVAAPDLASIGIAIVDDAHDRIGGLIEGKYSAAPLSSYALVEALPRLGDKVGVDWIAVAPVGAGSDRIVVRHPETKTARHLYTTRIGALADGLELQAYEHLFDSAGLPPKLDYLILSGRSACVTAFLIRDIDALLVPQPGRAHLLAVVHSASTFLGDRDLPRFGFCAPFVYLRAHWTHPELTVIQGAIARMALQLSNRDDAWLRALNAPSLLGIRNPAIEIATTIRWPDTDESARYLNDSFITHLKLLAELQARRFNTPTCTSAELKRLLV